MLFAARTIPFIYIFSPIFFLFCFLLSVKCNAICFSALDFIKEKLRDVGWQYVFSIIPQNVLILR